MSARERKPPQEVPLTLPSPTRGEGKQKVTLPSPTRGEGGQKVTRPSPAGGESKAAEGRFAYEGLERAIHEKARLGILTSLAANPKGLPFGDLKELCSLTDGNLNRHLAVLEEERLITISKLTRGRRPLTIVMMTASGRARFQQYINVLERVVADAARMQVQLASRTGQRKPSAGWSPA